jgi:hypothetical protein
MVMRGCSASIFKSIYKGLLNGKIYIDLDKILLAPAAYL